MRLLHCSDLHIDENRRLSDTEMILAKIIDDAREAEVALIAVTGDIYDADNTERERRVWSDFLMAATEVAPVVAVRGNHCVSWDGEVMRRQHTKHPVLLYERPTTAGDSPIIAGFGCIAIPWFARAAVAARLPASIPSAGITMAVNELAGHLLIGAAAEAQRIRRAGAIPILLHHGTVNGARFSSGFVPRGLTVEFTEHQLADVGAEYVALGHYHATQEWQGGRIAYAGSTERTDFGEPEAKGFRLVTFEGGKFARNEFVELPARRIELIEEDFTDHPEVAGISWIPTDEPVRDALVRFRYRVRPQDLHLVDEDAIKRTLLDAGAHEVKVEAVVEHEARVRCEAITTAASKWEEFLAWAEAAGYALDEAQRERLRMKLAEIESPARQEVAECR